MGGGDWSHVPLDAAFEAVIVMDAGGRVRNLNHTACTLFGYRREEAVGQAVADLVVPERLQAAHLAGLLRIAQGEEPSLLGRPRRLQACRADGSELPVEITVIRSHDQPQLFTGFIRDLSDLRDAIDASERSQRRERRRYEISSTLREWEREQEGIPALLARLGTAMEWVVASLWVRAQEGRLRCGSFWSVPELPGRELAGLTRALHFPPGRGLAGRAWTECRARADDEDLQAVAGSERRRLLEELGIVAGAAFPIVLDEDVLAVCEFFVRGTSPLDELELRLLDGVGGELGHVLARRRAELEPARLSPREREVLQLSAEGRAVAEIAHALQISPMTVKSHFRHIYEKLDVPGRTAAVAEALRVGLIR